MQGLERNSDIVVMGSYAPIFVNEHNPAWRPDMIRFNAAESFGTPSYHVQQMMANHIGTRVLPVRVSGNTLAPTIGHRIGFTTWGTQAEFRNLEVKDAEGHVLLTDAFDSLTPDAWSSDGETADNSHPRNAWRRSVWKTAGGVLSQMNPRAEGSILLNTTELGDTYTLRVQARRLEGNEGFIVVFGAEDKENLIWWNLGGWGNSQHAIEHLADGGKNTLAAVPGHLEEGRWYDVEVQVRGTSARCLLDGQLIHEFSLPERQSLYASATLDEPTGEIILKMVNPTSVAQSVALNFGTPLTSGRAIILASPKGSDENTMREQLKVSPEEHPVRLSGSQAYTVRPFSLTILRLKR